MADDPHIQELKLKQKTLKDMIEKQELWLGPHYRELERARRLVRSGEEYLKTLEASYKEVEVELETIKASSALATGTPPGEQTGILGGKMLVNRPVKPWGAGGA